MEAAGWEELAGGWRCVIVIITILYSKKSNKHRVFVHDPMRLIDKTDSILVRVDNCLTKLADQFFLARNQKLQEIHLRISSQSFTPSRKCHIIITVQTYGDEQSSDAVTQQTSWAHGFHFCLFVYSASLPASHLWPLPSAHTVQSIVWLVLYLEKVVIKIFSLHNKLFLYRRKKCRNPSPTMKINKNTHVALSGRTERTSDYPY